MQAAAELLRTTVQPSSQVAKMSFGQVAKYFSLRAAQRRPRLKVRCEPVHQVAVKLTASEILSESNFILS